MSGVFLDLAAVPWSCRGSWLSISAPVRAQDQPLGPGFYLRSHHSRPLARRELFLIEPLSDGRVVKCRVEACDHLVRWVGPGPHEWIEGVFDDEGNLRFRGAGLSLRLRSTMEAADDPAARGCGVAYPDGPGRFTVNCRPSLIRIQFERMSGVLTLKAPWVVDHTQYAYVLAEPGPDGVWEFAADEFTSTWMPRERLGFDSLVRRRRQGVERFNEAWSSVPEPLRAVRDLAGYVLWSCTMRPYGQLTRESVFMSLNWMDQVWSWDNVFNAMALATGHPELAMDQLRVVHDHQDEFGAFPDGLNDGFKHYNFSKPPVQGILLDYVRETVPGFWTPARLMELKTPLARFTRWWLDHRRYASQDLCYYLHGNDSGWDNATLFCEGVPLVAPDLNTFLVRQCEFLAWMEEQTGGDPQPWLSEADRLTQALFRELWNGQEFCGKLIPSGTLVTSNSLIEAMPALLGDRLDDEMRRALRQRFEACLTPWGLATEAPDSPLYVPDGYWRGPIWGPSTFLAVLGLRAIGERGMSAEVVDRYLRLCARSGFAENFDALSGEPLRDRGYTWTASVWLAFAREAAMF